MVFRDAHKKTTPAGRNPTGHPVKKGFDKLAGGSKISRHCLPCRFLLKTFRFHGAKLQKRFLLRKMGIFRCHNRFAPAVYVAEYDWKLERDSVFSNSPKVFRQSDPLEEIRRVLLSFGAGGYASIYSKACSMYSIAPSGSMSSASKRAKCSVRPFFWR